MTPKEKAQELYTKFLPLVQRWDDVKAVLIKKENAKECALIVAKEVRSTHYDAITEMWWDDVIKEIEKI